MKNEKTEIKHLEIIYSTACVDISTHNNLRSTELGPEEECMLKMIRSNLSPEAKFILDIINNPSHTDIFSKTYRVISLSGIRKYLRKQTNRKRTLEIIKELKNYSNDITEIYSN